MILENRAKKEQMAKLKQTKENYLKVFESNVGKKVLKDLEELCFINKSTYSDKPGGTFINEGMRMVIVHIQNMMNFDLQTLNKIVQEGE